ncbi:putative reverse transcriptase domain, viral movement protein [Tanacetum coccineum]
MITIFEPILANTLVYIDDILLVSSDEQSHAELLSKFYSLVTKYGIILSEKKMEVGVTTIQFLNMEISDGKYQPQPHVAQELLKFLDKLSSQKMIQQFLRQTEAVKAIKCLAEKIPPLKILASAEKRILQTYASDECWGAVLLVQDNNNKRHVCGYKSGTFKASEQHYHSTFKEILAVKRGIEKFQFHLIGHEFQVEMDMSSFPRMLQFKRKMLPHAQLLRWSNWFSQWKFTVKHIKGTENVLADFLSRPKAYKSEENYPKDAS